MKGFMSLTDLLCFQGLNDRQLAWMGPRESRHCRQGRGRCSLSARSSLLRGQARAGVGRPRGPNKRARLDDEPDPEPSPAQVICPSL